MSTWVTIGATASVAAYLFALNKRLTTPNPSAYAYTAATMSDDDLAKVAVPTPQEMAEVVKAYGPATGKAYVVVGGSGLVGQYVVRTLLARGETLVRIVDIVKPRVPANSDANAVDSLSRAEFIQADVVDYRSIADAISRPFGNTGRTAEAVIHTVAVIRSFERLGYLKPISHRVNVEGTKNILRASQELGTVGSFVYTSSAGIFVPPANFLRLGLLGSQRGVVFGDDIPIDAPKTRNLYISTKFEAEGIVRAADGVKGVRTGALRPGMAIMGPESIFVSFILDNPGINPTWGGRNMNSMVNAWDLGRAHVQLSDALFNRPEDVAGQFFAITGQATVHSLSEVQRIMQFYSQRDLQFREVSELMMYTLSYFVEGILFGRYLILKLISYITGSQVAFVPRWAVETKLQYIQPAMWDFSLSDTIVDDSRARKVLGYRNYWSTEQTLRWTVEVAQGRYPS
ncbi:hypothetical protein ACGC1H_002565 [Rhizoctonia solani]|uniref:Rhodanese domain-containing protein n=1 Tax=Rhizoctonia solani TaxID=456999 RepID=A0A8H3ALH1_9AGAM|nr:unnamed protein product [Rhizoctonia solani]